MAKRSRPERPESFKLADFSDREFLFAYDRAAGEHGATAADIAESIGANGNSAHGISVRLGWLRRLGIMEREERAGGLWIPTSVGEELLASELRAAQERTLSGMTAAQRYAETAILTQQLANSNNRIVGDMMARQLRHGLAQHRKGRR